jgi:hypothetical protein
MFPELAAQQRGEIDAIAGRLNNQYTQDARAALGASMASAETMEGMANQELALGRSMSPEQLREATQSARQAFAARGLATGAGAAGAELLNRDAYATQREQQRRTFAADLLNRSGAMRQSGAGLYTEIDPYGRAINPGIMIGQGAQQLGLNAIGQNYAAGQDLAANTGSFNTNMGMDLYNSWLNNATAVQTGQQAAASQRAAANTSAAATRQAGTMQMIGAGVGTAAGIGIAAIAI